MRVLWIIAFVTTLWSSTLTSAGAMQGTDQQVAPSEKWRVAPVMTTKLDVGTVYVRIKREFSFMTLEERKAATPGVEYDQTLYNSGFMYSADAGVRYLMRDRDGPARQGRVRQITIEKTPTGAQIEFAFATAGLTSVTDYENQMRARILKVLK